jgi:prepilin-type N-terminal cleavage/methylation domain-containing protein
MKNSRRNFKNQAGFNLIELMIVIAIIALLIGVGIPAWQSMIKSGNETTAAQTMQTIRTCQASYSGKHQGKFAPTFAELVKAGCLDEGKFKDEPVVINGYVYSMNAEEPTATKPAFYKVNIDPQVATGVQATGNRYFYFDSNLSAVKFSEDGPAKPTDPSM